MEIRSARRDAFESPDGVPDGALFLAGVSLDVTFRPRCV
jgi:hypothetical protein